MKIPLILTILALMSMIDFMISLVEHENSRPGFFSTGESAGDRNKECVEGTHRQAPSGQYGQWETLDGRYHLTTASR